jgi:hypothetical protein
MGALAKLLFDMTAARMTVVVTGERVRVRAPIKPANDLIERVRAAKPDILTWHRRYHDELERRSRPTAYSLEEVRFLAFGALVND